MKSEGSRAEGGGKTLVCFAVREEAGPFQKLCGGRTGILIRVTGIGRRNAERALRDYLPELLPARVFTCGFAGGLDPSLKVGDTVFSTSDVGLGRLLSAAGARPVQFHSASGIASTSAEKLELRRATGADAVEMESGVIQAVCGERGIPCTTLRAISDTAGENLPLDFNVLMGPSQELRYGKLAVSLLKSPGRIPALIRLQKQSRTAAEALARVLAAAVLA